ncbi:hypothetical protein BGX28_002686 [Mortierella sp. GBA30]|nr:hypothetical protein BGX28_002686 [Mortierella sp. GBA30]
MLLFIYTIITIVLSIPTAVRAQDANCTAVYNDFAPSDVFSGAYQKCYTDQLYNSALVAQGTYPDYDDVLSQICTRPLPCSHSTLISATNKYLTACNASIDAEAANGNVLQIGKNALEIFFAEPIRSIYCALDPNAVKLPPPAITPPAYCLANPIVGNPTSRFTTDLAFYLTSGSIRSSQAPFFESLGVADTCSPCSQLAFNATVGYLSENLMPRIAPFYTPEFVRYWTKLVPAYNTLCKTSIVQTWPKGTLNAGPSATPTTSLPTAVAQPLQPTASPHTAVGAASALAAMSASIPMIVTSVFFFQVL